MRAALVSSCLSLGLMAQRPAAVHSSSAVASTRSAGTRIAVLGGGITGTIVASRLTRVPGADVTIFEMGRGFGGRMASRRTREPELKGLVINHGAPSFCARTPRFRSLLAELEVASVVRRVDGRVCVLRAGAGGGQIVAAEDDGGEPLRRAEWEGLPSMSAIADYLGRGATTRFSTMIAGIERGPTGCFRLTDKDGTDQGEFDRIVVTSHTLAHSRFENVFAIPPPLRALAEQTGSTALASLVRLVERVPSVPVLAVLLALSPTDAHVLDSLPFAQAEVLGSARISKVVLQRPPSGHAVIVVHSTPEFAHAHANVHGSSSTAARMGAAGGSEREAEICAEVLDELRGLLEPMLAPGDTLPAPAYGPLVHRWGSAFVGAIEGLSADEGLTKSAARLHDEMGITVCGDFLPLDDEAAAAGVQLGSVEAAALSAMAAAQAISEACMIPPVSVVQ
ncbi:hypothetical protein T492DRAFT_991333 [Pavlovales sp. CCMP2436]|nr:hypothetical protein T492DRAFT_991333 [Pavlovales sp. CCMP2436]|mmetsp:Transcript_6483/g.16939  ORF Transcript_6483/g.16939 Transcript_6483/m.16939 type:complete len:451 (-) Transcript_6483:92-1444(-)